LLRKSFTVRWGERGMITVAPIRAVQHQTHPGIKQRQRPD